MFIVLYNFWKSHFLVFLEQKRTNPSLLLFPFQGKFSTTLKNSLFLFLSKSSSSLGISLTFSPSGARPWKRGRRLRLLFVTFQLFHRGCFFQAWNRDSILEYTFHYFSSFPSNRDPFPYFLESFSTNGDPWSLANSRALNTKVWKGFAADPFSKVFLIDTGNVERGWNRARVSNEPIKPRKWWSRVIFVSHMMWCDIQLMDNRWDSAWYVCHFSVKFYFRWKLFLQLLFDNVKTSGKMKIICSIIVTWFFHTNILLARLIIECTHYT